jgi:5-(carboxyamino)imidazole ribonucleotide mutase
MKKNKSLKVSIVMGSQSDYKTMQLAEKTLKKIGVSFETKIISAHRTPKRMYEFASSAQKNNIGVIIAGAGGISTLTWDDCCFNIFACIRCADRK